MIYEYDEIITAKDVLTGKVKEGDIVGKEGWFADTFANLYGIPRGVYGTLTGIDNDQDFIFLDKDDVGWAYFLPQKEESYIELQAKWVKANNIKAGDKVRITRGFMDYEGGAPLKMNVIMPNLIGKILEIKYVNLSSISVWNEKKNDWWYWPYFVLEKVEDASEPATEGIGEEFYEKKSYAERQAEWVKANNLKPGDKVRIIRGFEPLEDGFCASMNSLMKDLVGEVLTVIEATPSAIRIWDKDLSDFWAWPYFVLEKVKDEPEYIPFDLSDPKDRDFLRGKWVRSKNPDVFNEFEITHFVRINNTNQDIKVETSSGCTYFAGELLYDYEFLDGSPVGKRAKGQQMK